tara:strand:- start:573 stop:1715 length:1143 start_codon:yes stop_codon:yes gene_type:complete
MQYTYPVFYIIGAGPVGLTSAILLSEKFPNANIFIFEKRTKYKRKQILLLQKDIFENEIYPYEINKMIRKLGCVIKPPASTTYKSRCGKRSSKNTIGISITTNYLEKILYKYMSKNCSNTKLISNEFLSDNYIEKLPDPDFLLGCDGAQSIIADQLMNAEKLDKKNYYGLICVLDVDKSTRKKMLKTSNNHKNNINQYRFRAFSSKKGNFYLGMSISKKNYDLALNGDNSILKSFVKQAAKHYGWKVKKYDIKPFKINTFYRDPVIIKENDFTMLLVGDAAFSGHFFSGQALCSGIREANFVANNIENYNLVESYTKFVDDQLIQFHRSIYTMLLPFEEIEIMSHNMSSEEIKALSKSLNINIKGLDKYQSLLFMYRGMI